MPLNPSAWTFDFRMNFVSHDSGIIGRNVKIVINGHMMALFTSKFISSSFIRDQNFHQISDIMKINKLNKTENIPLY